MKQEYTDTDTQFKLPKPQMDSIDPVIGGSIDHAGTNTETNLSKTVEQIHARTTSLGQSASTTHQQQNQALPVSQAAVDDNTNNASQSSAAAIVADDVDLIEKEWVEKAKNIINSTKNDPYVQNKQLNNMKAEYLKARFNKEVKISHN